MQESFEKLKEEQHVGESNQATGCLKETLKRKKKIKFFCFSYYETIPWQDIMNYRI